MHFIYNSKQTEFVFFYKIYYLYDNLSAFRKVWARTARQTELHAHFWIMLERIKNRAWCYANFITSSSIIVFKYSLAKCKTLYKWFYLYRCYSIFTRACSSLKVTSRYRLLILLLLVCLLSGAVLCRKLFRNKQKRLIVY